MKYIFLPVFLLVSVLCVAQEQQVSEPFNPEMSIKWAPAGLYVGNLGLSGEYSFGGKRSLTAKIGIPVKATRTFDYNGDDVQFEMKATTFMAGYRNYFSRRKKLSGFYIEPFFKYVHHSAEGFSSGKIYSGDTIRLSFTNTYDGFGIGAQLGVQWRIRKRVVLDLFFLGPEINSSRNNLRAVDRSSTNVWTDGSAEQIETDVKEFIDQFPFIRNRVDVVADKNTRTVTADFKGFLPGIRTGVSIGIAL